MMTKKLLICLSIFYVSSLAANDCCNQNVKSCCYRPIDSCCNHMGGVSYCDVSAGRLVCRNGFYSACYCTRHAVMDLQLLKGCCLWKGGVAPTTNLNGLVSCNDGSISEECSLTNTTEHVTF